MKSRRLTSKSSAHMDEIRNVYKILVGKSEGKRLLGRPRCRRENNIKTDLKRDAVGECELDLYGS
jgi:hypothetical protein